MDEFTAMAILSPHSIPSFQTPFDLRIQRAELDYLVSSNAAITALAENHVGLAT